VSTLPQIERLLRERLDDFPPAARAELLHIMKLPDFEQAGMIGEYRATQDEDLRGAADRSRGGPVRVQDVLMSRWFLGAMTALLLTPIACGADAASTGPTVEMTGSPLVDVGEAWRQPRLRSSAMSPITATMVPTMMNAASM
jgi:hypothetical protein